MESGSERKASRKTGARRRFRFLPVLLALAGGLGAQGGPPVPPDPIAGARPRLLEALDRLNLKPSELGFDKKRKDDFALRAATSVLDAPLTMPNLVSGWRMAALGFGAERSLFAAFRVGTSMAGMPPFPSRPREASAARTPGEALLLAVGDAPDEELKRRALAWNLRGTLGKGLAAFFQAAASLRIGFTKHWGTPLVGDERRRAMAALSRMWTEDPPALDGALEGVEVPKDLGPTLHDALRLDWDSLAAHALGGLQLLDRCRRMLAVVSKESLPPRIEVEGIEGDLRLFLETPAGGIALGGPGRTIYRRDLFLVLDLGGDDRYEGRVGAASAAFGRPISICLDLGGNDLYLGKRDRALDQGAALCGVGILLDVGKGADLYRAGDLAQGAGILGLGMLFDDGGRNDLAGRGLVQGAAGFGFGVCALGDGDDRLDAARFAQGFGGVRGFGLLLDTGGDDLYRAGGVYLHAPLFQDRYQSLSQGFGIGERYRDASGGLGFLWSGGKGNDLYLADIYGQGAGYWMGVGALVDEGGNDAYVCGQYGQGAGIHLAAGMLWDLGGNDDYTLHHGVGQGGAHDLAVGWLLEGGGDDYYQGAGLTQGGAKANALAFLLDLSGNDCYAGARVGGRIGMQGYGERARGFGSVGLCLDFGGDDVFAHRPREGEEVWERGEWGLCWDLPGRKAEAAGPGPKAGSRTPPLPKPLPEPTEGNLEALYAKARLWQVGKNVPVVARARAILAALGPKAGRWMIRNKLGAAHTLDRRALRGVIPKIGAVLVPDLREALKDEDPVRRWNAIDLLQRMEEKGVIADFIRLLRGDPEGSVRRKAAVALGAFGAAEALPAFDGLIRSEDPADRRTAAQALAGIPGTQALHRLAQLLGDPSFTVRDGARVSLLRREAEARPLAVREIATVRGPALREWLRLLARWKPSEARPALEALKGCGDAQAERMARAILDSMPSKGAREGDGAAKPSGKESKGGSGR